VAKLHKVWSSRFEGEHNTYVGEAGRLFYDEAAGSLRISDGFTAGGNPIGVEANLITAASILPDQDNVHGIGSPELRWGHIHIGDEGIYFDGAGYPVPQTVPYLPGAIVTDLVPAYTTANLDLGSSTQRWGNVFIGPNSIHLQDQTSLADIEMTVRSGTLYLDGAQNLAVGNLVIVDTTLTSAANNLDINVGATDDTGFFYVRRKAQFDNTTFSSTEPMVSFNASGPNDPTTIFPDTVVQTVSRPNKNSRVVQRSYGSSGEVGGDNSYSVWSAYSARGNVTNPAAIKANDILSRVSSNGYGTTTWGTGGTRIESVALENFTDSAKGSKINFWTTPVGSIVSQQVASITATGISANSIVFVTDGTVQTSNAIPFSQKAIPGAAYVATLGVDGKLDSSQIPTSLSGAIVFKGGWDAAANTNPALGTGLPAGVQAGWEYAITTTGTQNLGGGSVTYQAGGFVIYGNNQWEYTPPVSNFTYATATVGTHLKINNNQGTQETGVITVTTDATSAYTASTIVSRDASGNFAANVITAALSGQATSALTAATVTAGVQSAITAVGTLTSLAVTGNVATGNVSGTKGTFTTIAGTLLGIETDTYISALRANITAANTAINSLATGANANTAAYLTTATINTTGNITAGNVIATAHYGNVVGKATQLATAGTTAAGIFLAGSLSVDPPAMAGKNISVVGTYTITGLTTSHKVIIMPQAALPDSYNIGGAWASSTNTLSINFQSYAGAVDAAAVTIAYFAWV
jgi:hypothetical protein